jgi:hypothetical protein
MPQSTMLVFARSANPISAEAAGHLQGLLEPGRRAAASRSLTCGGSSASAAPHTMTHLWRGRHE